MESSVVPDIRARELLTVVTLAEYGSFVAAASHLNTSQPALTRTVKRVERVLGVMLFARNTRRVEITPAGREFVAVAERVLNDLRLTVRSLEDVSRQQRGTITISTYSSFASFVVPEAIRRFRHTRPLVEIKLREGRQPDIIADVRSGVADFGVGYMNSLPDGLDGVLLKKEAVHVLIPTTHALARDRPSIALAELRNEPLVSAPLEGYLRRLIDGAAAARGFALQHAVTVDRLMTIPHHVASGVGIGILPSGCLPLPPVDGFQAPLLTEPPLSVDVALITLHARYQTPAALSMMELVRELYGET